MHIRSMIRPEVFLAAIAMVALALPARGQVFPPEVPIGTVAHGENPGRADRDGCTPEWLPGEGLPGVDCMVKATAVYDDGTGPALYIAGNFTVAGDVVANHIVRWDGTNWTSLAGGMDQPVHALTVYGGRLIAGGGFTTAGGVSANYIASWDGTDWAPLGSGLDSGVTALAVYDGDLIAAGGFTTAGGVSANYIAKWDKMDWAPLGSGLGGDDPYTCARALVASRDWLIVGGNFTTAGGESANYIASWDGTSWAPLGTGMSGGEYSTDVYALSYSNRYGLVAAGGFDFAGGTVAHHIARWDGESWARLDNGTNEAVTALTCYAGKLIAGGHFTRAGGSAKGIAAWDGDDWEPLGSGCGGYLEYVTTLAVYNGELVAGGEFATAGEVSTASIAKWDGTDWAQLGSGMNDRVLDLTVFNGELIAGGYFSTAGDVTANHISKWDGTSWATLGAGMSGGSYQYVAALTTFEGDLIAGGKFSTAGDVSANAIARWDGTSWAPLGTGVDDRVYGLTVYDGELIAGGNFATAGGVSASCIAKWDGADWAPLGSGLDGPSYPVVHTLTVYNGELIAGGNFATAGEVSASCIAKWDGTDWAPLGSGVNYGVGALAVYNGDLIAGGSFTTAGGGSVNHIARWDGTTWAPLGSGVCKEIFNASVSGLCVYDGELIAGGVFDTAGGVSANGIAKWDGTHWFPMGEGIGWGDTTTSSVGALAVYNGELIAGGRFTTAGGQVSGYWARWGLAGEYLSGDLDCDDDVDFDDWSLFAPCLAGPEESYSPGCLRADLDGDGDSDLSDFATLQCLFAGS